MQLAEQCQCFLEDKDCTQAPTGSKVTLCLYSLYFSFLYGEQLSCNTVKQQIAVCLPKQLELIYLPLKYQIVMGYIMAFPHCSQAAPLPEKAASTNLD